MSDPIEEVTTEDINKVKEYYRVKKALKTLRRDLTDIKIQHKDYDELEKLKKKTKELRENIANDEEIKELTEKTKQLKERLDLMKEMIRIDLIESSVQEVKGEEDGKVLRLIYVLKEVKDTDRKNK